MNRKEKIKNLNIIRTSLMNCGGCEGSRKPWYVLDEIIKELKTPIQKGEWIPTDEIGYAVRCSQCSYSTCTDVAEEIYNFCPNCGLPMNDKALEILAKRSVRGDNEKNE